MLNHANISWVNELNLQGSQLVLVLGHQLLQLLQLLATFFKLFLTLMLNRYSSLENCIFLNQCLHLFLQHHVFLMQWKTSRKNSQNKPNKNISSIEVAEHRQGIQKENTDRSNKTPGESFWLPLLLHAYKWTSQELLVLLKHVLWHHQYWRHSSFL